MFEVATNPSLENLKVITIFLICVITIAGAIIGYFINRLIKSFDKLNLTLDGFNTAFVKFETKIDTLMPDIKRRLDSHGRILDRHESVLKTITVQHNMLHKTHVIEDVDKSNEVEEIL